MEGEEAGDQWDYTRTPACWWLLQPMLHYTTYIYIRTVGWQVVSEREKRKHWWRVKFSTWEL